jgi:hypothetical protein
MKRPLAPLFCIAACVTSAWAGPIDSILQDPNLWAMKQPDFMRRRAARLQVDLEFAGFRARYRRGRNGGERRTMTLFGLPFVESIARFDGDKLTDITVTFYSRGDVGDLPKDKYTLFLTAPATRSRRRRIPLSRCVGRMQTVRSRRTVFCGRLLGRVTFWSTALRRAPQDPFGRNLSGCQSRRLRRP